MKISDFWFLMEAEFGFVYAHSLAADLVLDSLGERSAVFALEAGFQPRFVWLEICCAMGVPKARWLGDGLSGKV